VTIGEVTAKHGSTVNKTASTVSQKTSYFVIVYKPILDNINRFSKFVY